MRKRALRNLLAQLHGAGGVVGRVADAIVHELEETGYLYTDLAIIAEARARRSRSGRWTRLVQSLDPRIAARTLEECIALQPRCRPLRPAMARLIAISTSSPRADARPQADLRGR